MHVLSKFCVAILALAFFPFSVAEDCPKTAVEMYLRAQDFEQRNELEFAEVLYRTAAEACDRADYWRALGDIRVKLRSYWNGLASFNVGNSENEKDASFEKVHSLYAKAFVAAIRDNDIVAGAAASRSVANLGILERDLQLAYYYLSIARQLDPEHPELPSIQKGYDKLRYEQIQARREEDARRRSGAERRSGEGGSSSILASKRWEVMDWSAEMLAREYVVVPAYFATDREYQGVVGSEVKFGTESSNMRYGIAHVSVPRSHKIGELERPKPYMLEFGEDPRKHIILLNVSTWEMAYFFSQLREKLESSTKNSALVYIHGYNVTFEDAARRTAQMAYDLNFPGVPLFYAWPSQGNESSYSQDVETINWSAKYVQRFLEEVLVETQVDKVYLVAHNMGSRALANSITSIASKYPEAIDRIAHIILAAPDINADIFIRDIAPALARVGAPVSLYASSNDPDLKTSAEFSGGKPRAGDSQPEPSVVDGIDTIDASRVITALLEDGYWAADREIIVDLKYLIHNDLRAASRAALVRVEGSRGVYWKFGN